MTEAATTARPRLQHRQSSSRTSRPAATPSARTSSTPSTTHKSAMTAAVVSPRIQTPHSQPQNAATPQTPSPNYFGLQAGESFLTESSQHAKQNWSPPSSSVRSAAATSPIVVPLDQNPDFEAFRRQSEGKSFALNGMSTLTHGPSKPRPSLAGRTSSSKTSPPRRNTKESRPDTHNVPTRSLHAYADSLNPNSAELSHSPKRVLSPGSLNLPEAARRGSPARFDGTDSDYRGDSSSEERAPRVRLPLENTPRPFNGTVSRSETMPEGQDPDSHLMKSAQHIATLMQSAPEQILLLDLRVQTQYAQSHIEGALSLCIPTTLLKRPSFNVQKLAETFKDGAQRARFENWKKSQYIIVYDGSSSLTKDAQICMNTIKKFGLEGYEGNSYIIKGGFAEFSKRFPKHIVSGAAPKSSGPMKISLPTDGPEVAPVVGGCPMPGTDKPANPFFGNIRQNMDLIGGVGQIALKYPTKASPAQERAFPHWLKDAAKDADQGKKVAGKFEAIERREKKRMEDALSGQVSYGSPRDSVDECVQIAGLEKGNKNRYNNIWPFEHSRVKLQGVPSSGCDYFNANYIKASWSNKRYISTQAPIPATFNDFWNVIWQQDVRVIVMLTAEKEGAQVKAHNYWDQRQYGPLHLEFLSEKRASLDLEKIQRHKHRPTTLKRTSTTSIQVPLAQIDSKDAKNSDQPYVTVRRFTLSHQNFPFERVREVTQLQYSSWPDFGAPADPAHLLGLVEQCDAVVRATEKTKANEPQGASGRPVLVHCSAGCGRTGTFCTVDSVIDMLKRQRIANREQKQQQNNRHTSPMDVDSPPPAQREAQNSRGGGFFASQSLVSNDQIDGQWVARDDQDLVEKTVEDFRHQRLSMVQSLRQYVLCYESVMEWLCEQDQVGAQ